MTRICPRAGVCMTYLKWTSFILMVAQSVLLSVSKVCRIYYSCHFRCLHLLSLASEHLDPLSPPIRTSTLLMVHTSDTAVHRCQNLPPTFPYTAVQQLSVQLVIQTDHICSSLRSVYPLLPSCEVLNDPSFYHILPHDWAKLPI